MIHVTVHFFASHRDIVGQSELRLELNAGTTLAELWERLVVDYPLLDLYRGRLLFALNEEFSTPDAILHDGDEVAYIPPVSGGSDAHKGKILQAEG